MPFPVHASSVFLLKKSLPAIRMDLKSTYMVYIYWTRPYNIYLYVLTPT